MLELDYFYGNEAERYSYYSVPTLLFTDPYFKQITDSAKILYGLILNRMSLSRRNGWLDEQNRVFIYFTLDAVMEAMGCGHNKAVAIFTELDKVGLIERKKQGQGRPTKIYIKDFVQREEVLTSEKRKSALPESGSLDFPKSEANYLDLSNLEFSNNLSINQKENEERISSSKSTIDMIDEMDSCRELIRENIGYEALLHDCPDKRETIEGYVELMVEACCTGRENIRINKDDIPAEAVRSRLLKLEFEHIRYVMDCMEQTTTKIGNIKAYVLSALYNAPATYDQYIASLYSYHEANPAAHRVKEKYNSS